MEDWFAGSGAGPEDIEAETGAGTWAEAGARAEGAAPEGCEAAGRGREEAAAVRIYLHEFSHLSLHQSRS